MAGEMVFGDFTNWVCLEPKTGILLDFSKTRTKGESVSAIEQALAAMKELELGSIANHSEQRMVGHYWLRNPSLAPSKDISTAIQQSVSDIQSFAKKIHDGKIKPEKGDKFTSVLVVGIGGSALGPQFVSQALSEPTNPCAIYFFDNTDPDGIARVLRHIPSLQTTLTIVISKSGGTKETRNGMLIAKAAYEEKGLSFEKHAVAVTSEGSELSRFSKNWIAQFPMWDWVGGRTSELSAVGLLPAALQGFNIAAMLTGAKEMDEATRKPFAENPAARLALAWYELGSGKGDRAMVVLPYSDRLELFSKYLQQLVMESLGKKQNLLGEVVHQGITVYGNKGATDQHAYVQQLRDGLNNFFAVFVRVLKGKVLGPAGIFVEEGVTASDYLDGFFLGTRQALFEAERPSISITIPEVSEYTVGALIALFERAVGLYATMVNINAYDQPGVEAGKKAAAEVLALQQKITALLTSPKTVNEISAATGGGADVVFYIIQRLLAHGALKADNTILSPETRYTR